MLNHNRAHETAGILRQKINYILVVNTEIRNTKAKQIQEIKWLKEKVNSFLVNVMQCSS